MTVEETNSINNISIYIHGTGDEYGYGIGYGSSSGDGDKKGYGYGLGYASGSCGLYGYGFGEGFGDGRYDM